MAAPKNFFVRLRRQHRSGDITLLDNLARSPAGTGQRCIGDGMRIERMSVARIFWRRKKMN
jgi:hypothetical protein